FANLLLTTTPQTVFVWPAYDAAWLAEIDSGASAASDAVANAPRSQIAHLFLQGRMRTLIEASSLAFRPSGNSSSRWRERRIEAQRPASLCSKSPCTCATGPC